MGVTLAGFIAALALRDAALRFIGAGKTRTDAAREVSRFRRSIQSWCQRPDFQTLIQAARDQALSREPTAAETLRAALLAIKSNGEPDWPSRSSRRRDPHNRVKLQADPRTGGPTHHLL